MHVQVEPLILAGNIKTPQAEEHNAQWEIKTHGLKKIEKMK